jgi:ketosteroid isomerase-like protein
MPLSATILGIHAAGVSAMARTDEAEIRALLERAAVALRTGDWDAYAQVWAQDAEIAVLHPAEAEWLEGWGAVGPAYRALFASGARPAPERRLRQLRIAPSGDMAWATAETEVRRPGPDRCAAELWQTFVFERRAAGWRLVHVHASVPGTGAKPSA